MTQLTVSVNDVITAAPSASCDADLARGPWDFDLAPGYGPGASELDVIPEPVIRPGQLPTVNGIPCTIEHYSTCYAMSQQP